MKIMSILHEILNSLLKMWKIYNTIIRENINYKQFEACLEKIIDLIISLSIPKKIMNIDSDI